MLGSVFRFPRALIGGNLEVLLQTRSILVEDADDVARALDLYRQGADSADALIGASNARQGCTATATFDRQARLLVPTFEAP